MFSVLPILYCCLPHRDKVKKLIDRGRNMISKELDIVRILKTLRYVRTIRKADKEGKEARKILKMVADDNLIKLDSESSDSGLKSEMVELKSKH
jgi:hypothetical protein